MLRDQASRRPDVVVVESEGVRLTLAELRERVGSAARGLMARGVEPGDRIAVWGLNDPAWVIAAYAVWDAGAVIVPLSSRYKGIEAAQLLRKTRTSVVVTGSAVPGAAPYAEVLGGGWEGPLVTLDDLDPGHVSRESAEERALAVRPDDLCEIMSTSGTTGTPKGVMLDHAQIVRGYWDWSEVVTLREGDRYPIIAPFAHGFGLNAGLLATVMRAATMLPIPIFTPDLLMKLIESGNITILAGAPPMFYRLLDELDQRPRASDGPATALRVAICGAASVPADLITRMLAHADRMINAYGLMEGTVVSMTREGDPVEVIANSTGRAVPGIEVKIVDDGGAEVPRGERGEILERGYGVMRGYWGEPGKTAEVVVDGWLHTGDVGTMDADGNVAIVDRKKELFIANGFNVSPAEVEGLLLRCPDVAQVAVIGVPDERMGEAGLAYVVLRPGGDAGKVIPWAKDNMSNYKVPRRVAVLDALPVNANGKIDKPALRGLAQTASEEKESG
ncbi:AMP-binding protein [Streptosporangiaceae bacterium NEAU-GS5]|nr:AMP-binding protein [Streptosporangiaceae bacterium NEAU-GS5]